MRSVGTSPRPGKDRANNRPQAVLSDNIGRGCDVNLTRAAGAAEFN